MDNIITTSTVNLLLVLISIVVTVYFFLKYGRDKSLSKIHTMYISGYAVLIIICLLTYICVNNGDNARIIDYISFGATLSSLLMSVVAIIFTIVTSKQGNDNLGRINEATAQLQKAGSSLKILSDSLNGKINSIEEMLGKVLTNTDYTSQTFKMIVEGDNKDDDNVEKGFNVESFVGTGSFLGNLALFAACQSFKASKSFDFNVMIGDKDQFRVGYMYAYLVSSSSANVIKTGSQGSQFTCNSVNYDNLEELVIKAIHNFIKASNEFKNENLNIYNCIRGYFELSPEKLEDIIQE